MEIKLYRKSIKFFKQGIVFKYIFKIFVIGVFWFDFNDILYRILNLNLEYVDRNVNNKIK